MTARDNPEDVAVRELFTAARRDVASDAELAAVAQRLHAALPAGALGQPAWHAAAATKSAWPAAAKWALLGGVVAAVSGGALLLAVDDAEPVTRPAAQRSAGPTAINVAPSPASAATVTEPSALAAPATAGAAPPLRRSNIPSAAPTSARPSASRSSSDSAELNDLSLLQAARRALADNPRQALSLIAGHRSRFPSSALTQERDIIEMHALLRLGQNAAFADRARSFRQRYPRSAHLRRIEAMEHHLGE
jgi:hypothetical protein